METTHKIASPAPISKLLLPKAALANCIFGAFVRDTRGCNLTATQRFNHFASSPLCAVSWQFEGQIHLLESSDRLSNPQASPVLPKLTFSGPYQTPQTSWNAGDVNAMILAFYPDAMSTLSGIAIDQYINRTVAAKEVLSGELLELFTNVLTTGNPDDGFEMIEQVLLPLWRSRRTDTPIGGFLVSDWCRSLAVRAALSEAGKSTRQMERRFRAWTGQSRGKLDAYAKSEEAFKHALAAKQTGRVSLADMSAELGYSDQSHMGRNIRQITGFSPAEFLKRYDEDEAFWSFRLLGERF